jgi:hypothetical protein
MPENGPYRPGTHQPEPVLEVTLGRGYGGDHAST